jgi:hypothetical protein
MKLNDKYPVEIRTANGEQHFIDSLDGLGILIDGDSIKFGHSRDGHKFRIFESEMEAAQFISTHARLMFGRTIFQILRNKLRIYRKIRIP